MWTKILIIKFLIFDNKEAKNKSFDMFCALRKNENDILAFVCFFKIHYARLLLICLLLSKNGNLKITSMSKGTLFKNKI